MMKRFAALHRAAAARRRNLAYDVAMDEAKLARIAEAFPSAGLEVTGSVSEYARFIFIVGLPRSGTTLLEKMLTRLPEVRSNGEYRKILSGSHGGSTFERLRCFRSSGHG